MSTAGGSAYFDQVAEVLTPVAAVDAGTAVVLRSGAYLVHDDGFYRAHLAAGPRRRADGPSLGDARLGAGDLPSRTGLALLDAGKRDLPFDEGLPEPQRSRGPAAERPIDGTVTALERPARLPARDPADPPPSATWCGWACRTRARRSTSGR